MKVLLLLLLIFGAAESYAQQIQQKNEYIVTKTMNLGYIHNQKILINSFRELAPTEYDRAWKYISYELNLEDGVEFDDLYGEQRRTALIMLIPLALDYFSNKGD